MIELIVWIIVSLFSTFGFVYLYYKFTNSNKKINLYAVILYFFGAISVVLIDKFDIKVLKSIFFFIYFPILFYIVHPMPLKKLFYYVVIIWFYGGVIDILAILLISLIISIFNGNFSIFTYNSDFISMIFTSIIAIGMILLTKCKYIKSKTSNLYEKIGKIEYTNLLLVVLVTFIVCIDITMILNINYLDINLLLILVTILTMATCVILFKYKLDAKEIKEYLNTLRENNKFYVKVDDDNRIFKHNLTAKLSSVKSVGSKKVNVLIDDLILQFNKSIDFADSMKVIPYGLNGIIYQKLYPYLDDLNVKINNDIKYDIFTVLRPRRYNVFVEKIMLALDNAIEACLNSEEKALVINIFDDEANICVEIENTFAGDINLDLLGTKNYSTKGKRRGLGLFSMFRNNEAKISVKIINNLFVNKITTKKRLND